MLELNVSDLESEWMQDHVEDRVAEIEDMTIEKVSYMDLWPEDDPNDYETILDKIMDRMGDDADLEDAIIEANEAYYQRTGIRRGE